MAEEEKTKEGAVQPAVEPAGTQPAVEAAPEAQHNKLLLAWKAPEFISHPKGKRWFLTAGIITLALIAYALYTNSATMAIVFIVLAGVYYLTHNQEAKIIDVEIRELGIFADNTFYSYNTIESFWIVYDPRYVRTLNLKLTNKKAKITIQLNNQDPAEVRRVLSEEIPEMKGAQEGLADNLIRLLRL